MLTGWVIFIIIRRLKRSGEIIKYYSKYTNELDSAKDETCNLCKGTGVRTDMNVENGCNKCNGSGKVRPWKCHYPFEPSNVYEFMDFCRDSGGFEIC